MYQPIMGRLSRRTVGFALLAAGVATVMSAAVHAQATDRVEPAFKSAWVAEHSSRVRIVAGGVAAGGDASRVLAGLELELDDGWKTYWRNPGSSGVPPRIDVEGSENLAKAELLFPAPRRFKDRDGDTIGYKSFVVLPIGLTPADPSKAIVLKVAAEIGICREVCIPIQPSLTLSIPPDAVSGEPGSRLSDAFARVPKVAANAPGSPHLQRVAAKLSGEKPLLIIDAFFPGDADQGDVFLEAPDGIWIPLAQPSGAAEGGARRFVVDLTDGADLADLRGRRIRMTLVGATGQSETSFDLVEKP